MGKKHRNETEEERKERKRAKKEATKANARKEKDTAPSSNEEQSPAAANNEQTTPTAVLPTSDTTNESPFVQKRLKMLVSLYPVALGDAMSSMREILRSMLLKYSDGLGGILLGFDNIKFADGTKGGIIMNELPAIHYYIQFDALLFCPEVGTRLTGVVNECFPSHVGMLVHSYFNAMISSDHLSAAGYTFDRESQQWLSETAGNMLANDDKISFVTEKIHESDGIISMEGSHPTVVS